jgi:DNA-binding winged helix-turn-helix (wHTH) protein/pimeloyl-ACP methyl ester carboxylesterase
MGDEAAASGLKTSFIGYDREAAGKHFAMPSRPVLNFDRFKLDSASGQLYGDTGPIPLTPKALSLLEYLAARPGLLVNKNELLDAVWPGVFVADGALKVCIREIRHALGDDAHAPRIIETAHRRGYRFIADVSQVFPSSSSPSAAAIDAGPTPGPVQYARSGDVNIAYQVCGSGQVDLVFVMGWVSHLEYFWKEPSFARFLGRLASFSRLILFDKRGTGLSDPVTLLPTLEQRMDDVRAVLDAVGSKRAVLLGISEGGPMCQQRDAFLREIADHWGGPVGLAERAPSVANDPAFREWWASFLRMGASPSAAIALTRMNAEIDVRHVLPTVRVPTLVMPRTGDRCLLVEEGRYVASLIPGARYVEFPGEDHLPFVGNQDALLSEIERFLNNARSGVDASRVLVTILCAEGAEGVDADAVRNLVAQHGPRFGGTAVQVSDKKVFVAFDGPARAIRCGCAIGSDARRTRNAVRLGLHTGECDLVDGVPHGVVVESAVTSQPWREKTKCWSRGPWSISLPVRDCDSRIAEGIRSRKISKGGAFMLSPRRDCDTVKTVLHAARAFRRERVIPGVERRP